MASISRGCSPSDGVVKCRVEREVEVELTEFFLRLSHHLDWEGFDLINYQSYSYIDFTDSFGLYSYVYWQIQNIDTEYESAQNMVHCSFSDIYNPMEIPNPKSKSKP